MQKLNLGTNAFLLGLVRILCTVSPLTFKHFDALKT